MIKIITQIIFIIVVFGLSIKLFIKGYKDSKSDFEKSIYIFLSVAIIVPLIVYY